MSEHIVKRGGRYYYRRRVPLDLVDKYGKKEHTQALGTSDRREADKLARRVGVQVDSLFDSLRNALNVRPAEKWGNDPQEMWEAAEHFDDEPLEYQEFNNQLRNTIRLTLAESAQSGQTAAPPPPKDTTEPQVSAAPAKPNAGSTVGLAEAIREWEKLRAPSIATVDSAHRLVARFQEACGKLPLRSITREHITKFQASIAATGASANTARQHLGIIKAVLSAAVEAGMIKTSPALNVRAPQQKRAKATRLPFGLDEIKLILDNLPTAGFRRWIPLIALYTGMRLEEIGQLAPGDIRTETYRDAHGKTHKVPVIYAVDEGEGQGLKNESSRRRVPVHPELVRLGLLDYVAKQKHARVFSELKPNRTGRETASFSSWFGTWLRAKGVTDTRKTFHSFRHLFKDVLREHGVEEQVSDALTGHTNGSVGRAYGGEFYPLRPLVEAVNKFELHL